MEIVLLLIISYVWSFSIRIFVSKFDQIRRFLRIWSHLLKKSLVENFAFSCFFVQCQQLKKETAILSCSEKRRLLFKGCCQKFGMFRRKHLFDCIFSTLRNKGLCYFPGCCMTFFLGAWWRKPWSCTMLLFHL